MSFLEAGFILREDIIKLQWKMKSTPGEMVREDVRFLSHWSRASVCVQETGCGREDDEVQGEHEVVVGAAIFMGDRELVHGATGINHKQFFDGQSS